MIGNFRDSFWRTVSHNKWTHNVYAVITDEILQFSVFRGNYLITPITNYRFPALKEDDRWHLHLTRWISTEKAGKARKLI